MKANVKECQKIIDNIVFNNPKVKKLVNEGLLKPKSRIEYDYVIKNQTALFYDYTDGIIAARLLNFDDGECLFGFSGKNALKKAANNVIIALTQEFNYDSYYEPYEQDRYNGD